MHTTMSKMDHQQGPIVEHRELCSMLAAWIGGEFVGKWISVYLWLSLYAVNLKLSQHF